MTQVFTQLTQQIAQIQDTQRQQKQQEFFESSKSQKFVDENEIDNSKNRSLINISKHIEYFYSNYMNINNFFNEISIVTIDKYIYYRDVYIFIDRLKNFVDDNIDEQRIKKFFFDYLKRNVII